MAQQSSTPSFEWNQLSHPLQIFLGHLLCMRIPVHVVLGEALIRVGRVVANWAGDQEGELGVEKSNGLCVSTNRLRIHGLEYLPTLVVTLRCLEGQCNLGIQYMVW